jgi:hypothetical protein
MGQENAGLPVRCADRVASCHAGELSRCQATSQASSKLHLAEPGVCRLPFTAAGLAYISWYTEQILGPSQRWVTSA